MSGNDDVDGWIAQLMQCKPLSENEVKKLCDKVGYCCFSWGGAGCGLWAGRESYSTVVNKAAGDLWDCTTLH